MMAERRGRWYTCAGRGLVRWSEPSLVRTVEEGPNVTPDRWQTPPRGRGTSVLALPTVVFAVLALLLAGCDDGPPDPAVPEAVPEADGSEAASAGSAVGWSRVAHREPVFGGRGRQQMLDVAAGGPGLVAVGLDTHRDAAAVWTSPDGSDWSRVAHDEQILGGDGRQGMYGVAAVESGLVAVGTDGLAAAVWSSPDGTDWSRVTPGSPDLIEGSGLGMFAVTAAGPGLVAVGSDLLRDAGAVWTSTDGQDWARVPHDDEVFARLPEVALALAEAPSPVSDSGSVQLSAVVAGGPGVVAVGEDGASAAVWTSEDGLVWSRVAHDEEVFGGSGRQWMAGVSTGGPGLVAVGFDEAEQAAAVWTSPDGLVWSRVAHDPQALGGSDSQSMRAVVAAGPGVVAVGGADGDPAVWTSPDGLVWSRVPHDEDAFGGEGRRWMWAVTAGGPGLVGVGAGGNEAAGVWTSP